jgi:hypothetical protein
VLALNFNLFLNRLPLWDAFNYKPGGFINESTWAHDIIDSISRFIGFDISELRISW